MSNMRPHAVAEMEYHGVWWYFGSVELTLDVTLRLNITDVAVTLAEARVKDGAPKLKYWQLVALIEWVADHQDMLRRTHATQKMQGYSNDFDNWDRPPTVAAS
jgi:hypothetical protein